MPSPFHGFRKYQRQILVIIGVICIFTFTVGPVVLDWFRPDIQAGSAAGDTVVSWKGGELTENDLGTIRAIHQLTIMYLDQVVAETSKRGGTPKGPGVTPNRAGQIVDPGISRDDSEIRLVRTLLLAEQAEKLGMELPDEAIVDFLAQLSDRTLSSEDLRALLTGATRGRLTRDQLFDNLRRELLARNYLRLVAAGDVMTPEDAWSYYNRLTRRVTTSILAYPAEKFLDQAPQPSDKEVQAFYEKYKDQFPMPSSPEPGFKQRPQFEFAYFRADYDRFMEEEKAKIDTAEVQKYYDEHKENYKVPELPPVKTETESQDDPGAEDSPAPGETEEPKPPATDEPQTPAPADNPQESATPPSAPSEAEPGDAAPSSDESKPENDAESDTPADQSASPKDGAATIPAPRLGQPGSTIQQVALLVQEDEAAEKQPPGEESGKSDAQPSDSEPAEPEKSESQPAGEEGTAAPKPTTDSKAEPTTTDDAPTAAPETDASDESAKSATDESQPATKEPEYQPLSAVEDDIRRTLASQAVRERMDDVLSDAKRAVEKYGRAYASYLAQTKRGAKANQPEPPKFEELATQLGLEYNRTPLVDELTVGETELGKTFTFGPGFQQISFAQIAMYTEQAPLYKPARITSGLDEYLYWPVQVKESRTPSLEDIREQVVRAWRLEKAFEIAMQEAQKTADKIRKAPQDKPLAEVVGVDESQVIRPPAFSWMTSGAVAFGGGSPYMSEVEGVENVGQAFMEEVFNLRVGQVGVAPNASKDVAYVVRLESETPGDDVRRDLFWQAGIQFNFNLQYVAQYEQQRKILAWLEEVEKEWGLDWKRPPRSGGSMG